MIEELFERFPTPIDLATANEEVLRDLIRPLGLSGRRSKILRAISEGIVDGLPIEGLPGVGEYALQAVEIFCKGRTDVKTKDVWLNKYLSWRYEHDHVPS